MKNQDLTEFAYNYIKEKIIKGEFKSSEILSISSLAETLNISRTPVNNACQRLEAENLLIIVPKQGVIVKSATIGEFRNLYELRAAIETYAAKLAFSNITEHDIKKLNESLALQEKALSPINEYEFMIEDMKFHQFLISKSENPQFISIIDNINNQSIIAGMKNFSNPKRICDSFEEHKKIIDALKNKDKNEFIRLIEENIINGYINLTSHFRY